MLLTPMLTNAKLSDQPCNCTATPTHALKGTPSLYPAVNHLLYCWQVSAVWHNMREEPVIYINGRPFVLREDERPFKNLQEYTGIDVHRLEQMELRLKNDILQVCLVL